MEIKWLKSYLILPFYQVIQKWCKGEIKFRIQSHMIKGSQNNFYGFFCTWENIFYVMKNAKISNYSQDF